MYIVSACLAGLCCRYDGKDNADENVKELVRQGRAIPVCPEQLGGLSTPRPPCEIVENRVMTENGVDFSESFLRGAEEALKLAKLAGAEKAILKARSPSCGIGKIYDGTFSRKLIDGDGLFAALLRKEGIKIKTE
ncbi:DUF523 domain-containing protein [Maridesulfovibrio zosterae]|uniref:DUF523 domain-containing protein n=1 Tax=Maridesulfovibrio zosterae TaxID=82171 RepID=UPI0003FC17B7|nr:DUF523 domain-containing protein [Maridesulfovibrio zosterae]